MVDVVLLALALVEVIAPLGVLGQLGQILLEPLLPPLVDFIILAIKLAHEEGHPCGRVGVDFGALVDGIGPIGALHPPEPLHRPLEGRGIVYSRKMEKLDDPGGVVSDALLLGLLGHPLGDRQHLSFGEASIGPLLFQNKPQSALDGEALCRQPAAGQQGGRGVGCF